MGTVKSSFYDILCKVKSWIPLPSARLDSSRSFWMPDASCRLCYECEIPFTIFNRRHHCRVCGRVFCGKCTSNTIPASCVHGWNSEQEGERIRVCVFCYNSWEQQQQQQEEVLSAPDDEDRSSEISHSASATSLETSNGASSDYSGDNSVSAMPFSTVPYQHITYNSPHINENNNESSSNFSDNSSVLDVDTPYKGRPVPVPRNISIPSHGNFDSLSAASTPPTILNQSDDEEDDYSKLSASKWRLSKQSEYYNRQGVAVSNTSDGNSSSELPVDSQKEPKRNGSEPDGVPNSNQKESPRDSEDLDSSSDDGQSPIYAQAPTSAGPPQSIDIVNNNEVFIPPEAENKEDEKETSVFEEDDDFEDNRWGLPRSTDSFSDNEYKSKDKSSQEYDKAMRNLVDGHFRALVAQLLKEVLSGEGHPSENWLEIVTSLSWVAANYFRPDTSKGGGGMDPGGYVKVKCLACGRPSESEVIRGIVCTKNVADRRMTTKCKNARILLLGGALEYQRQSNQLSSMDTLLHQEMEHLKMSVAKIEVHRPNVLLVENSVSNHARKSLQAKDITFVLNVKRPLLERIARCTGAHIVPSIDNLATAKLGKLGYCENFHVEKFLEEHGSAGQNGKKMPKNLMFFDGCPTRLGCTVLLKGADGDVLKKIKRVLQYAVFAAYHLALETSFLADEGATLTGLPIKAPISAALAEKKSALDKSISVIQGFTSQTSESEQTGNTKYQRTLSCTPSIISTLYKNACNVNGGVLKNPDVSATVSYTPKNLTRFQLISDENNCHECHTGHVSILAETTGISARVESQSFRASDGLHAPEVSSSLSSSHDQASANPSLRENFKTSEARSYSGSSNSKENGLGPNALESDASLKAKNTGGDTSPNLQDWNNNKGGQNTQNISEQKLMPSDSQEVLTCTTKENCEDDFPPSPSDQQSILVILSTRCLWKGTVCERARLFRIKYYGNFDKPLGRFLRDDLFDQSYRCQSCESPPEAHVHCYTHKHGSLTIVVKRLETTLPGQKDGKIWMWHLCQICAKKTKIPQPTRRIVMSDAAWGLSFGKFLELSFSNHAAASRASTCGHSLHRDCLRFYGFGRMVACFQYLPIHVHSVHLPPPQLEFYDPNQQEWLKLEAAQVADKAELFFAEVFDSLRQMGEKIANSGSLCAGVRVSELRKRTSELEGKLQKEKSEFEDMLQKSITKDKPGQPYADILVLNRLRRQLLLSSCSWDRCLRDLDSFLKLKRPSALLDSSVLEDSNSQLSRESRNHSFRERLLENVAAGKDDTVNTSKSRGSVLDANWRNLSTTSLNISKENDPSSKTETIESESSTIPFSMPVTGDTSLASGVLSSELNDNSACREANPLSVNKGSEVRSMVLDISKLAESPTTLDERSRSPASDRELNTNGSTGLSVENRPSEIVDGRDTVDSSADDQGVNRAVPQGDVSVLTDLTVTLDEKWSGKGQLELSKALNAASHSQVPTSVDAIQNYIVPEVAQVVPVEPASNSASSPAQASPPIQGEVMESGNRKDIKSMPDLLQALQKGTEVSEVLSPVASSSNLLTMKGSLSFSSSMTRVDSFSSYVPTYLTSMVNHYETQSGARMIFFSGINDTVFTVRDDEPTSLIAYALMSSDYHARVAGKLVVKNKHKERDKDKESVDAASADEMLAFTPHGFDTSTSSEDSFMTVNKWIGVGDPFLQTKDMHVKVSFSDERSQLGKVKYSVICYYAKQFEGLRRKCCPEEMDFIRSLSRCKKWGAQGGKSNVFFAKTLDDRFIIKQVTKTELDSFLKFAPDYFKYLSESLSTGCPTCLAKILGIYQVTTKKGGKESRMDVMAMENLLYGRNVTHVYDLKGAERSRFNGEKIGRVLFDENLLDLMSTSLIFVGKKAKRLLERAVWNDTSFLATIAVMDYSLLVGIDEERHELVLGIIDFMRQYTWDKHLESWVKASGILGGPRNSSPTVISPKQYKKRFRKAMSMYFLVVPDQWSPGVLPSSPSRKELTRDSSLTRLGDITD